MPKPLAGGHELLLTHQELSGSGEYHRTLRSVIPIVFQRKGQKDKELVEKSKSFIHRPEEGTGNDPRFGSRPSGVYQLQTSCRSMQREAQRTPEEEERSQEPSGQGQRQFLKYVQDSYGIHSQRAGKDEQDLSMQRIQEIQSVKSSIDVELGKFDAKLNKITSYLSELKINEKNYTEWYKLRNFRLDSITSKCDRI
ncbi:hypothetical protein O181_052326 [Austropuccinia psidii MF-1]|uniref:Uncharacterized protein n=1 Tax=Austropuccinia psidii MF-1 TaxID=1389203 RepID=A0A9Q3DY56_9BASI|nr:hypothetical protein [Austropuccinia psidii MF-1]